MAWDGCSGEVAGRTEKGLEVEGLETVIGMGWKRIWKGLFGGKAEETGLVEMVEHFQELLDDHQSLMELMADLGEKSGGEYVFDRKYIEDSMGRMRGLLLRLAENLNLIGRNRYVGLYAVVDRILLQLEGDLRGRVALSEDMPLVVPLSESPTDHPELTGGKAEALACILQRLRFPVPDGFVVTTRAYRRFIEHNRLEARIHGWLESWNRGDMELPQVSRKIRFSILAGIVPSDVAGLIKRYGEKKPSWAVRSSACGEDGQISFAGLHETVLDVSPRDLIGAYRRVLASLFSVEALSYRRDMGLLGEEAAMAVLFQEMVPARVSGVLQTLDPVEPHEDRMVFHYVAGPGRTIMEGKSRVQSRALRRSSLLDWEKAEEPLGRDSRGGREEAEWGTDDLLPPEVLNELGKWGLALERFFKQPQEIEWALDLSGRSWILQSRPLVLQGGAAEMRHDVSQLASRHPVLVKDRGTVVHAGVGAGVVFHVRKEEDLQRFPDGGVLVSPHASPWLAAVVRKASAILTEKGSSAGHLATIAREFRVPTLFGVEEACSRLRAGEVITVDTKQRVVYGGRVEELLIFELARDGSFEQSPEFRLLRRLLKRIAPLHLADPQSPDFSPQGCRTVHDVLRFAHEKAVEELMEVPRSLRHSRRLRLWELATNIPIGLRVLDLGGGIDPPSRGDKLELDRVTSLPLKSFLEGLCGRGLWSTAPAEVDMKGMMSSLTKTAAASPGLEEMAGFNLALVTKDYLNLHLRLGYHINLIDARILPGTERNHVYFRFVGGVTDITRRSRRAQLLAEILSRHDFRVEVRGDLVIARTGDRPEGEMKTILSMLGCLVAFTRQLDIELRSDDRVEDFVRHFMEIQGRSNNAAKV
jgi:pyruvate,water dikinase